jgi:hypothetical protein
MILSTPFEHQRAGRIQSQHPTSGGGVAFVDEVIQNLRDVLLPTARSGRPPIADRDTRTTIRFANARDVAAR